MRRVRPSDQCRPRLLPRVWHCTESGSTVAELGRRGQPSTSAYCASQANEDGAPGVWGKGHLARGKSWTCLVAREAEVASRTRTLRGLAACTLLKRRGPELCSGSESCTRSLEMRGLMPIGSSGCRTRARGLTTSWTELGSITCQRNGGPRLGLGFMVLSGAQTKPALGQAGATQTGTAQAGATGQRGRPSSSLQVVPHRAQGLRTRMKASQILIIQLSFQTLAKWNTPEAPGNEGKPSRATRGTPPDFFALLCGAPLYIFL